MISAAGIDTWSPAWYLQTGGPPAQLLDRLAIAPAKRGQLIPEPIAGHRVGWNSSVGLLYAEGHPGGDQLLPPDELPSALLALEAAMREAGLPVPTGQTRTATVGDDGILPCQVEGRAGFAGVRRLDATVDVQTGGRARGLAILAGVAGVAAGVPATQAEVRFAKDGSGTVETVYLRGRGGMKVLGRWYDKGLESFGASQRGLRIRAEDQRRYPKGHRRGVEELTTGYVQSKFCERFRPLWQATKGVTVAGAMVLADRIAELVQGGELTPRQAEALAGYLVLSKRGITVGRSQTYVRRKRLRELGLVLADGPIEEVEIDLHEVLEEALETGAWGNG